MVASPRVTNSTECSSTVVVFSPVTDCSTIDETWLNSTGVIDIVYVNESTTYGSLVEVTCRPGTVALGGSIWVCSRHGVWTRPPNFRCQGNISFTCYCEFFFCVIQLQNSLAHVQLTYFSPPLSCLYVDQVPSIQFTLKTTEYSHTVTVGAG